MAAINTGYPTRLLIDQNGVDAIGEVQATPTEYTLLRRLKDLKTAIDNVVSGSEAQVDVVGALPAGTNAIGQVTGIPFSVADEQDIDASLGAYAAGDVVGADDCCTTLAVPWEWDVGQSNGGYVLLSNIKLINETENQAVQYDILLFNATPTGELRDNAVNDNPIKADLAKWLGKISLPQSIAEGATVCTYTEAYPGDGVSGLPKLVKCAAGTTKVYGVLLTNTVYTQTTGPDAIRIIMSGEKYL